MSSPDPRAGIIRRKPWSPGLRRLFVAQTVSRWGDTFNTVALAIVVLRLTGFGLQVAATVAFEIVPVTALGFVVGVMDPPSGRNPGTDQGRRVRPLNCVSRTPGSFYGGVFTEVGCLISEA